MINSIRRLGTASLVLFAMVAFSTVAAPLTWVDWTTVSSTSATGTLNGSTITLSASGGILPAQSFLNGTSNWDCGAVCNATYAGSALGLGTGGASNADMISIQNATTYTVTVTGTPISNPIYLAFMSVGQPALTVTETYTGIGWFVLQSGGQGAFGGSSIVVTSNTVSGAEGNGWVAGGASVGQTVSSFTFTTNAAEFYQGIQIGTVQSAVPEPGTLGLCLGGLAILGAVRKRRQNLRRSAV